MIFNRKDFSHAPPFPALESERFSHNTKLVCWSAASEQGLGIMDAAAGLTVNPGPIAGLKHTLHTAMSEQVETLDGNASEGLRLV